MLTGTYEGSPAEPVTSSALLAPIAPRRGGQSQLPGEDAYRRRESGYEARGFQMTQDDSDWVNDLFAAARVRLDTGRSLVMRYACCMRRSRAIPRQRGVARQSCRTPSCRGRTALSRKRAAPTSNSGARFVATAAPVALGSQRSLSQIIFEQTEKGRPYLLDLPHVWFSFSSCRLGFLGAWSSTHGVGVDLEDQTRALEATELAQRFFSKAEAKAVERAGGPARLRTFFQLWSLKEAALKSIGEGLPFGLDAFEFELAPNPRLVNAPHGHGGPEQFNAQVIEGTDTCAAVIVRSVA